jgi:hypothetical protein
VQFNLVGSPLPGLAGRPVLPARRAALGAVYPYPAMRDFPEDCLPTRPVGQARGQGFESPRLGTSRSSSRAVGTIFALDLTFRSGCRWPRCEPGCWGFVVGWLPSGAVLGIRFSSETGWWTGVWSSWRAGARRSDLPCWAARRSRSNPCRMMCTPLRRRRIRATGWNPADARRACWLRGGRLGLDAWAGRPARSKREGPTVIQEIAHPSGAGRRRVASAAVRTARPW